MVGAGDGVLQRGGGQHRGAFIQVVVSAGSGVEVLVLQILRRGED